MTSEPVRTALIMEHPAQQFTRALQLLAAEADVQLCVYYWSVAKNIRDPDFGRSVTWDVDLLGGYGWRAPASTSSGLGRLRWLVRQLRAARPQVVVCYGWGSAIARASILFCLLTRTRLLIYGDTTWQHSARDRHRVARSVALNILTRVCAGAVSTGTFNREFYIRYGMDPRRISPGICPVDTEMFEQARADPSEAAHNNDHELRIGFAGKLIARKGVDELLQAAALLHRAGDWSLTVVGDGPDMGALQKLAARLGVAERVVFHGFANTTEMPGLLASFDVVVVPSRLDMRALITIEAMAAGAATIVSDATAVWGSGDLIEDGVTGLVYPSGDPAALAKQLSRLLGDREFLAMLRRNGVSRAVNFGAEPFARTMAIAIQKCAGS